MKRFIYLLLAMLFIVPVLTMNVEGVNYENPIDINGYSYQDMEYLQSRIEEETLLMSAAHDMANAARVLGYEDDHDVIVLAKEEYQTHKQERDILQATYDELSAKWQEKRLEYPEATEIWEHLKEAGYSDYVCAGILGNIMTEVSGNTLAVQPLIRTSKHYGMCQWSSYYPEVWGASVEEQCNFLVNTIEQEFRVFGRGVSYEDFLNMTDCRQIALYFAKVYERCASNSYTNRQNNAVTAYNYFVS